jgi:hypothetical protein
LQLPAEPGAATMLRSTSLLMTNGAATVVFLSLREPC